MKVVKRLRNRSPNTNAYSMQDAADYLGATIKQVRFLIEEEYLIPIQGRQGVKYLFTRKSVHRIKVVLPRMRKAVKAALPRMRKAMSA